VISGLKVVIKIKYGHTRNAYKIWSENMKGRDHSEDLGIDRSIILKWILEEAVWKLCSGFIYLRTGTSDGHL
jgi:hypothetical protein